MSVVLVDIQKHRILDIIKDSNNITNYFFQYSSKARSAVKTVTVNLFTPYRKAIHELFPNTYDFYQDILFSLKQRDGQYLTTVLTDKRNLPIQMLHARKTIQNAYDEILNSFNYGFSNGPVEGVNNKIKVIK